MISIDIVKKNKINRTIRAAAVGKAKNDSSVAKNAKVSRAGSFRRKNRSIVPQHLFYIVPNSHKCVHFM
jgi:hypothetical protein